MMPRSSVIVRRCGASREKSRGDNAAKNRLNLPCPNWRATGVVPYGIDGALAFDDGAAASSNETLSPAQYDDQMRGGGERRAVCLRCGERQCRPLAAAVVPGRMGIN